MLVSSPALFREGLDPSSPRQMEVLLIKAILASELNNEWHSVLPKIHYTNISRCPTNVCFGAFYDWQCYACAIWTSPVSRSIDYKTVLELRRLAISPQAPKCTATWMIGKMIKYIKNNLNHIDRLISYQDTEVHDGTIYKASNWIAKHRTQKRRADSWNVSRHRNLAQTTAAKIRWEYEIKRKTKTIDELS